MTLKRKIEKLAQLLRVATDVRIEIEKISNIRMCLWLNTVQVPDELEEISKATGILPHKETFYNSECPDTEVVEVDGIKFFRHI